MKKMELYSREALERLTKKNRIWKIVVIALYAAILIAEIVLALMLTTENKSRLIYWMMGVSIAVGWVAIYFRVFRYSRGRRRRTTPAICLRVKGKSFTELSSSPTRC